MASLTIDVLVLVKPFDSLRGTPSSLVAHPADWLIFGLSAVEVPPTVASSGATCAADDRIIFIVSFTPGDVVARNADWLIAC